MNTKISSNTISGIGYNSLEGAEIDSQNCTKIKVKMQQLYVEQIQNVI